jgi:hypothetical protein
LQRATSRVNNNSVSLPDRFYELNYDNAANRTEDWRNVKDSAHRDAYTANNLNQYSSRGNRGYQNAIGFGGAAWYYFQLTYPYSSTHYPTSPGSGSYFYSEIPRPGSSSVAEIVGAELKSVYGGAYGIQKLPYRKASESPQFDASGNLTSEDLYTYPYDAEDRLIKITSAVGGTASKEIRYDHLHRRVEEKDFAGGANPVKWRRFVWHGWMLIAEIDVNVSDQSKTVSQTFTWGPDVSGTIHGAAGIGGLLLVDKSSTQQFVAGDGGRGNVTVLLDALATGTPSANLKTGVEYAPYGEIVRSTGDLGLLLFRFQSKWALGQSWQGRLAPEHLDFGRRVYLPRFGRFLNPPADDAHWPGLLLRRRFDLERDLDVLAHKRAGLAAGDAEVFTIDRGRGAEPSAHVAERRVRRAAELAVERHALGDAVEREIPDQLELLADHILDLLAGERELGELRHVEEIGAPQMVVAPLVARVDAARLNGRAGLERLQILRVEAHRARELVEMPGDIAHAEMLDLERKRAVDRIDGEVGPARGHGQQKAEQHAPDTRPRRRTPGRSGELVLGRVHGQA